MISCCKDCKKRKLYCHSTCETYINAKTEHDKMQEIRKKEMTTNEAFRSHRVEECIKTAKRKRHY